MGWCNNSKNQNVCNFTGKVALPLMFPIKKCVVHPIAAKLPLLLLVPESELPMQHQPAELLLQPSPSNSMSSRVLSYTGAKVANLHLSNVQNPVDIPFY